LGSWAPAGFALVEDRSERTIDSRIAGLAASALGGMLFVQAAGTPKFLPHPTDQNTRRPIAEQAKPRKPLNRVSGFGGFR
jgi:hypothetical protein